MKNKTKYAVVLSLCLMVGGCIGILEGATVAGVLGYVATNGPKAVESAGSLKQALEEYGEATDRPAKVAAIARLYCRFRARYPGAVGGLRDRLSSAGVSQGVVADARVAADSYCDLSAPAPQDSR